MRCAIIFKLGVWIHRSLVRDFRAVLCHSTSSSNSSSVNLESAQAGRTLSIGTRDYGPWRRAARSTVFGCTPNRCAMTFNGLPSKRVCVAYHASIVRRARRVSLGLTPIIRPLAVQAAGAPRRTSRAAPHRSNRTPRRHICRRRGVCRCDCRSRRPRRAALRRA